MAVSPGVVRQRLASHPITTLPKVEDLASVPIEQVPPLLLHLSALQAALASRLAIQPTAPAPQEDSVSRLLTAKQLAGDLSFRLDRVYELARTGRIPSVHIGRTVRFDVEAVRRSLAS